MTAGAAAAAGAAGGGGRGGNNHGGWHQAVALSSRWLGLAVGTRVRLSQCHGLSVTGGRAAWNHTVMTPEPELACRPGAQRATARSEIQSHCHRDCHSGSLPCRAAAGPESRLLRLAVTRTARRRAPAGAPPRHGVTSPTVTVARRRGRGRGDSVTRTSKPPEPQRLRSSCSGPAMALRPRRPVRQSNSLALRP